MNEPQTSNKSEARTKSEAQPGTCNKSEAKTSSLERAQPQASLEIACFSLESALTAARAGANRIEFTADYAVGGVTPSVDDFDVLRATTELPIYVLVRPRGGDFCHSEEELVQMEKDIRLFLDRGVDGFVVGCLTPDHHIDMLANQRLINAAQGKPVTFHRAFDEVIDYTSALEEVIALGCSAILTSGAKKSALEGVERLNQLLQQANQRIEIIIGGGIRSGNISELKEALNANFYHSACITQPGGDADESEIKRILEVFQQ
jgi:copper homeostasis protein